MSEPGSRGHRVLIVDDEPMNVEILEEVLEQYEVDRAYNGREALAKLETFAPDLILLDVMMPKMNGYDVCRYIRSRAQHSGAKVVFLSAKSEDESVQEGYDSGGDDYITKPFDPIELLSRLERQLSAIDRDAQNTA